jgi:trehalose 6-phosphate synthase
MPGVVESPASSSGRLLLVSNRLPITIKRSDDGQYSFSMSSGGLVTGLSGLSKTTSFQWYGWPGLEVPEAEAGPMREQLKEKHNAIPVFVDDELADRHYNGFASTSALPALRYPCSVCFWLTDIPTQTRFCGPSSTTTPARSPSTSPRGLHTAR